MYHCNVRPTGINALREDNCIYRWRNWGSKKLNDLPEGHLYINDRAIHHNQVSLNLILGPLCHTVLHWDSRKERGSLTPLLPHSQYFLSLKGLPFKWHCSSHLAPLWGGRGAHLILQTFSTGESLLLTRKLGKEGNSHEVNRKIWGFFLLEVCKLGHIFLGNW